MENDEWSEGELQASVDTYAEMYLADQQGEKVNKAKMYRDLEARFGRRNKAFERRMMNISHVVKSLGGAPVKGLLPMGNIGRPEDILRKMIIESGFLEDQASIHPPTTYEVDQDKLDERANSLIAQWSNQDLKVAPPKGLESPIAKSKTTIVRERSPEVKAWVLMNSKYVCECCRKDAPFKRVDGTPYLEVHHVVTLADNGPDTPENAVAVCPDCHRALHYSSQREEMISNLYQNVDRLRRPKLN